MNDKQALAIIAALIRYQGNYDLDEAITEAREYLKAGYRAKPVVLDEL